MAKYNQLMRIEEMLGDPPVTPAGALYAANR